VVPLYTPCLPKPGKQPCRDKPALLSTHGDRFAKIILIVPTSAISKYIAWREKTKGFTMTKAIQRLQVFGDENTSALVSLSVLG
jgi:hypothetical protein